MLNGGDAESPEEMERLRVLNSIEQHQVRLLEEKAIQKLNLHQIYAGVSIENTPSRALFKAAGYVETAIKKDWSYYENQFHDEIIVQKFLNV